MNKVKRILCNKRIMPDWPRSYFIAQPSMFRKKSVQPLIYLYISFFFESLTHSAGITNRGNDSSTYTSFCLAGVFYTHWAARSTGNRSFADRVAFTVILIARISSRSTGDSASSAAWALTQPQKTKISSIQGHLSKPRLHSSCVAS